MVSRRSAIRMTPTEEEAFLDAEPFGVLGTVGLGGHPHLVTMGFALDGPDTVVATSFAAAQKVKNAERTGLGSFLVERADAYGDIRGVLLRGRISVSREQATVAHCYRLVKERSTRLIDPTAMPQVDDDALVTKRVALMLSVESRTSWDHTKLGGVY